MCKYSLFQLEYKVRVYTHNYDWDVMVIFGFDS